jgi:DNA-binding NarL/FixJ family response regulator
MLFELGGPCSARPVSVAAATQVAREVLARHHIFEQLGSVLWAEKARAELQRTHLREAPADLTPSEQRVAELASSGLTNKQIGAQLFISPKTVEANLSRVYSKLQIGSRAELGARMASRSGLDSTHATRRALAWSGRRGDQLDP